MPTCVHHVVKFTLVDREHFFLPLTRGQLKSFGESSDKREEQAADKEHLGKRLTEKPARPQIQFRLFVNL
jgi:hypothetical protein